MDNLRLPTFRDLSTTKKKEKPFPLAKTDTLGFRTPSRPVRVGTLVLSPAKTTATDLEKR